MKNFVKWFLLIGCIVAAAAWISANRYQLMLIQGRSMEPSYHHLQLVLLQKTDLESIGSDDVIAFRCDALSAVLVKRIVAGPGQTVQIRDGKLFADGKTVERYKDASFAFDGLLKDPVSLGSGEYIVIGDNLEESRDSRYEEVGVVSLDSVIGKVL